MTWKNKEARNEYERRVRANRTPEQIVRDRENQKRRTSAYYWRHRDKILIKLRNDPKRREQQRAASATYRDKKLRPANYHEKLVSQNNLCALCGQPFDHSNKGMKPHYDHNHNTGQWRDFIHMRCNTAIGLLQDSPELCIKAAEYLRRHGG